MKAIVCTEYGPPSGLVLKNVHRPALAKDQVRIAVKTVGITFAEALMLRGQYQIQVPTPFVPGIESAGVITELGGDITDFQLGQRVIVGYGNLGGLAEEVVAYPNQLIVLPDTMSFAHAATFLQANATGYFALVNRGNIKAGETALILGAAGATGMAAICLAKALGATVIAAASSDDKLAACRIAGADEVINYQTEDLKARVKAFTNKGVDIVFDPVGGELSETALRCCAPDARFLVVGFATGTIPTIPLNLPLLKRCQIVGVDWGGTFAKDPTINPPIHTALIALFNHGKLPCHAITEYALEDSHLAYDDIFNRTSFSRPIVRVNGELGS